jgi:hypothetical protein
MKRVVTLAALLCSTSLLISQAPNDSRTAVNNGALAEEKEGNPDHEQQRPAKPPDGVTISVYNQNPPSQK